MKSKFILFISIALILLAAAHASIYEMLVSVFSITSSSPLIILGIVLGFLTVGFISLSVIIRFRNTIITRILYPLFAVWLGFFLYLFMASVLYWIVLGIGSTFFVSMGFFIVFGKILILAAVITSIAGIVQARTIRVTHYNVTLKNLPDSWKGKKIGFISDIHLGQIYDAQFAEKVTNHLNALKPDIIFIGGDLFDGVAVDIKMAVAPFQKLVSKLGTYFITGNHEEMGDETKYTSEIKNIGISVLNNKCVTIEGLQIIGVDYRDTRNEALFKSVIGAIPFDKTMPSILLKHVPSHLNVAEEAGIDLQFSGHTHRAQLFPFNFISHAVYHGFDYGLHSLKLMQVITSSGIGSWGPPLRVGSRSEIVVVTLQ